MGDVARRRIEPAHTHRPRTDDDLFDEAWRWAEYMQTLTFGWARALIPQEDDMSNVIPFQDFKTRRDRKELGLDEYRNETRRFSGMATRVVRRRPTSDDDGPGFPGGGAA